MIQQGIQYFYKTKVFDIVRNFAERGGGGRLLVHVIEVPSAMTRQLKLS